MPRSPYLGELEITVLLVLARLDRPTDGMTLYDEIFQLTGREMSAPTVYITLARLARKRFVEMRTPRAADGGGRARKLYALTPAGREARERSARMLSALLSPKPAKGAR